MIRFTLVIRNISMLIGSFIVVLISVADDKIRITDSHGKWAFEKPPERIAIVNWTLTEQLLELGISPVAIADLSGFNKQSPQTTITNQNNIIDLGSRFGPNLSKLKSSKPDLIIIGYSQRDLMRPLSNIAPVMYFNNFSRRFDNAKKADERFLVLAKLFNKTDFAKRKLQDRDNKINKIKQELNRHFNKTLPNLNIALIDKKNAWVFLENSVPFYVASKLGFPSKLTQKPSKLGTHKIPLTELNQNSDCVVLVDKSQPTQRFTQNKQCLYTMQATNNYGGAMSQLYLAEAIKKAILTN